MRPIDVDAKTSCFIPFTRINKGKRMIYGYGVTTGKPRSGRLPMSLEAMKEALPPWMLFRNVREMHQLSAVGKAHEIELDGKGVWLGVKIIDNDAWEKIIEGVYTGFSIGGKILEKLNGWITKFRCDEFSIVDAPDIPETQFQDAFALWRKGESTNKLKPEEEGMDIEAFKAKLTEFKGALEGVQAVAQASGMKRSLYNVERMVNYLEGLTFMRANVKMEESMEGDLASQMPTLMDELVGFFAHVTTLMMAEEVAEVSPEAADVPAADAKEDAPPPTATAEAVTATLQSEGMTRSAVKFSKKTSGVLRTIVRSLQGLMGFSVQTDEDMDAAIKTEGERAVKAEKDEKDAAAAAAKDDQTAAGEKKKWHCAVLGHDYSS